MPIFLEIFKLVYFPVNSNVNFFTKLKWYTKDIK